MKPCFRRKLNEPGLQNQSLQFMESRSRAWMEQDLSMEEIAIRRKKP
ncbi:MAG: hypothetical protein U5K27_12360 [Desulfotignum sp.]|nr:hypothetical protein [Desulfotignum sp.]